MNDVLYNIRKNKYKNKYKIYVMVMENKIIVYFMKINIHIM